MALLKGGAAAASAREANERGGREGQRWAREEASAAARWGANGQWSTSKIYQKMKLNIIVGDKMINSAVLFDIKNKHVPVENISLSKYYQEILCN